MFTAVEFKLSAGDRSAGERLQQATGRSSVSSDTAWYTAVAADDS